MHMVLLINSVHFCKDQPLSYALLPVSTRRELRIINFCVCIRFLLFFSKKISFFFLFFQHFSHQNGTNGTNKTQQSLHSSLSRLCDVVVKVLQSFKMTAKSRSQNASDSSRYMVVIFVPQSFCDVWSQFSLQSFKTTAKIRSQNANKRPQQKLASVF